MTDTDLAVAFDEASAQQADVKNMPITESVVNTKEKMIRTKVNFVTELTPVNEKQITEDEFRKLEDHQKSRYFNLPKSIIQIKPINLTKWHKKKGIEAFAQPITIEALRDNSTGGYATGLTTVERLALEAMTGYNLDSQFVENKSHEFWGSSTSWLKLPNNTMILNLNIALNFIKYKLAKANPQVANSLQEFNDGLWPEATHYIYNYKQEVEEKATKTAIKHNAFRKLDALTTPKKKMILQNFHGRSFSKASDSELIVALEDAVTKDSKKILDLINMKPEDLQVKAIVLEGLHLNILQNVKGAVMNGEHKMGNNLEDAAQYYANPQNQEDYLSLRNAITAKSKL